MKYIFLILALIVLSNCNYQNENDYFKKAYELEELEKYEEAIYELNKAIILNPKFEEAYLNRAINKAILGDYESAILDLNAVIKLNPKAIEPHVWRAEYKRMLEKYEEAMSDVEKALSLKNPTYSGTNIIGPKEFNQNKLLPQGENFNIELEFIVFERGAANYHLGNYEQALNDLIFCKQKQSKPINTHYYMGLVLLEVGKIEDACKELLLSYKSGEIYAKEKIDEYCKK